MPPELVLFAPVAFVISVFVAAWVHHCFFGVPATPQDDAEQAAYLKELERKAGRK